jgi:NADPH-dependent glutamate synthase beta subunit-like oxidoreductase
LKQGMIKEAIDTITENMPFPAITGRVCPHFCESECARKDVDASVSINGIERFLGDLLLAERKGPTKRSSDKKIAVIGSGPAGMACAYFLARQGYAVTVFEAMSTFGGMLRMGIPGYRLPRNVLDAQIDLIRDMGVEFVHGVRIGIDITFEKLNEEYQALFIGTGNQLSRRISLDGIESERVHWGLDFLRDVNLNKEVKVGEKVVVIGGGNVAVDVALSALRLGAREVKMVCLETGESIPAHPEEIQQALAEGIVMEEGWGPHRITPTGIRLARCLSLFDETGTFNPCLDEKDTRMLAADMLIFAIGQAPDVSSMPKGLTVTKNGTIQVDPITGRYRVRRIDGRLVYSGR